jgi:branched-chain amino acid transport system substrate-binding protein
MRIIALTVSLSVLLFLADICQAQAAGGGAAQMRLKIGAILPLSGSSATIGDRVKRAMELAHKDLPPEIKDRVQLFFEDDAWSGSRAVSAFQKLAEFEKVNAVMVLGSAAGMAVAPLAEQKKIVLMAVGASNINVVKGHKYSFLNWVTPEAEAEALVRELKRKNYSALALVGAEQEGMIAIYNGVVSELKRTGLEEHVVLDKRFIASETDYRTLIAKARTKKVDGVVLFLMPGAISSFAKQAKQGGLNASLVGIELFEDENEVKASEGTLIGQWYVTAATAPEFEKRYKTEYNEASAFGCANGYDAINLVIEAFKTSGSNDGDHLAGFLATVKDYPGAAGTYSASGDNRFKLPAGIRVVTEHGFEDVK